MIAFALGVAWAAEPSPVAAEEITVWGDAVDRARDAVERSIVELGYDKIKRRGDRTVFRHEAGWKGKVVLTDEGTLVVRRRGPYFRQVEPIAGTSFRPYPLCLILPTYCLGAGSWYVSDRRWMQVEDRVARATDAPLDELSERLADQALNQVLAELPDALEALWSHGTPLHTADERPPIRTYRERRAELLGFWESRTETVWGLQVREVVEAFVRGRVQPSDHPFTVWERGAFQAVTRSSRAFAFDKLDPEEMSP